MSFGPTTTPDSWGVDGRGILPREVAAALRAAGAGLLLTECVATCLGESGGTKDVSQGFRVWEWAWNTKTPGNVDRGPFQISSKYHPEVSDVEAYTLELAAVEMVRIVGSRVENLSVWNAWKNVLSPAARAGLVGGARGRSDALWRRAILAVANDRNLELGLPVLSVTW